VSYGIGKKDNEYARLVHHVDASKTVWMAIAVSFAMQATQGQLETIDAAIMAEWETLHANGIVPQKPRAR
jgi:hypothetical protein